MPRWASRLTLELTHVGVGIVRAGNGQLLVTEDFLENYQSFDTAALAQQLIQSLNEARADDHVAALVKSTALSDIALENSRAMMAAGKLDQSKVKALIPQKKVRLKYVEIALLESADPPKPAQMAEALKARYQEIGVGIVQDTSPSGVKTLWTTVLLGER